MYEHLMRTELRIYILCQVFMVRSRHERLSDARHLFDQFLWHGTVTFCQLIKCMQAYFLRQKRKLVKLFGAYVSVHRLLTDFVGKFVYSVWRSCCYISCRFEVNHMMLTFGIKWKYTGFMSLCSAASRWRKRIFAGRFSFVKKNTL